MIENNMLKHIQLSTMNEIANVAKMNLSCHFKVYFHEVYDKTSYRKKRRFHRLIVIGPVRISVNYGIRFIAIEYANYTHAMHIELDQFNNDFITMEDLLKRLASFTNTIDDLPF